MNWCGKIYTMSDKNNSFARICKLPGSDQRILYFITLVIFCCTTENGDDQISQGYSTS
jgi:hypothetical protein